MYFTVNVLQTWTAQSLFSLCVCPVQPCCNNSQPQIFFFSPQNYWYFFSYFSPVSIHPMYFDAKISKSDLWILSLSGWKNSLTSTKGFVCVEVLRPRQPNGVMSSAVSLPNHTFTGQALSSKRLTSIVHIPSPERSPPPCSTHFFYFLNTL